MGFAEAEDIVAVQFAGAVHFLTIAVGDAATFAGEDFEAPGVRVEAEDGVFVAGHGVVAADAEIHAGVTAHEVAFAVDAVVAAFVGAGDADQPADHRVQAGAFADQANGAAFSSAGTWGLVTAMGFSDVIGGSGLGFRGSAAFGGLYVEIGNAASRTAAVAGGVVVVALGLL